jgi:hypothetical protein
MSTPLVIRPATHHIQLLTISVMSALIALAAIALLLGMTACRPVLPKENVLLFETIERRDWSGDIGLEPYSGAEPRVILVTTRQEIDRLKLLVTQQAMDQLAGLDFGQYFVIAVFRGRKASSGHDTIVERVARRGNKIVIYAQFWELSPHYAYTAAETSPYHVIKVRRDGGVIQETELVLQSQVITPTPPSR